MRQNKIAIVGAPLDLGAGRRGVDMGPSALRLAGLGPKLGQLGYDVEDMGNVSAPQPESMTETNERAKYLPQIAAACEKLAGKVEAILESERFPLVLGGDHSLAVGTVAGIAQVLRRRGEKTGVIWVDAHADMNTPETTLSGNVHGMPLACCLGRGPAELTEIGGFAPKVDAKNVVLVGLRDVDAAEREAIREMDLMAFTMREIDEMGLRRVMEQAIARASDGTAGFHLSLDMDFVDPMEAPGVGTPVRGGVTYREAHLAMETICDSSGMVAMEIVEVNPVLDVANRTGTLGVELVMSAMGKKIL